jgi:hypothetical protein
MRQHTYIHIQEACHENWGNMTAADKGRFCQSCSKTVTDFSAMTDTEILGYLSKSSDNVCGRFDASQLSRSIALPATAAKKTVWAYLLSLLLPLMAGSRSIAQKKEPAKQNTEQVMKPVSNAQVYPMVEMAVNTTDTIKKTDSTRIDEYAAAGDDPSTMIMGLIMQYDKVTTVDTVTTVVNKVIKNELFRIYPNPAVKGKKISVQVYKPGEYSVQLLDLGSKMIVTKSVTVTNKGQMIFLDIPSNLSSGSYYLRLVQAGTNSQFVDKLVVK